MCNYLTISLKLSQKSYIWILKISIIGYSIFDHHESIEPCSKGKSTVDFRIESSLYQNRWVDESCSHEFYPTWSFADFASRLFAKWTGKIHLDTGFDEREISRTHSDIDLPSEEIREHRLNREFQVTDTDSRIYHHTLNLIKCILMRCIDIFIAKYSPYNHRSNRRNIVSQDEILHTGRLCCENIPISLQPERILHISSRMIFSDIHGIEVQILSCDFHRFMNIESHSTESILDFSSSTSHRMETARIFKEWNRDIFPLFVQSWFDFCTFYYFFLILEGDSESISDFIGTLSDTSLLFWWEISQSLEYDREITSLSENRILVFN